MTRVAVVGAGAAGLCAARYLLDRDVEVTLFELGPVLGGLWVYDNPSGRAPAYRSLHINSEARVTAFRGVPFPEGTPLYPSHEHVRRYLEAFAERFGLVERIRFDTEVTAVRPADGGRWTVRVADGGEEDFDSVVVATGHQSTPAHPAFRDDFTGEYLHSHGYRTPDAFGDRRVLVVGVGNSALDIATDVCSVTAHTTISARSPVLIMPRTLWGVPVARILAKVEKPWMPWALVRRIREQLTRVAHGRMEQWGFRTPTGRTHPATHPALIANMMWGRISARPGITRVAGREVEFADGTRQEFDAMIAATGYEVEVPFLAAADSPVVGRRLDLYRRIVSPDRPGLYFVGFFNLSGGAPIRMMDEQSRWLAAVVGGDLALPDRAGMLAEIADEHARQERLYPDSPRYGLELEPREYRETLRADLAAAAPGGVRDGAAPVPVRGR